MVAWLAAKLQYQQHLASCELICTSLCASLCCLPGGVHLVASPQYLYIDGAIDSAAAMHSCFAFLLRLPHLLSLAFPSRLSLSLLFLYLRGVGNDMKLTFPSFCWFFCSCTAASPRKDAESIDRGDAKIRQVRAQPLAVCSCIYRVWAASWCPLAAFRCTCLL